MDHTQSSLGLNLNFATRPLNSLSVVSSILRQNLSRFAYFEGYFLRSLLDCIFFRFSRIDYSRQELLVLYYVISSNLFKKFLIAMTSNLVPMINFGTYPTSRKYTFHHNHQWRLMANSKCTNVVFSSSAN